MVAAASSAPWSGSLAEHRLAAGGVANSNQLLAYTLQFLPVIEAMNAVLHRTANADLLQRVASLTEAPFD